MRGNFSRTRFPPSQRGALWMQQGRPLLDSDWNAQLTLAEADVRERIKSLVGPSGAPVHDAGFDLLPITSVLLNKNGSRKTNQAIVLPANTNLPFPSQGTTAQPFVLQIGFQLDKTPLKEGTLCHVPGLFCLSITPHKTLRLSSKVISKASQTEGISAEGKTHLPLNRLLRVDIAFNGQALILKLPKKNAKKPEIILHLSLFDAETFSPFALILGCRQVSTPPQIDALHSSPDDFFDLPLSAQFWQLMILGEYLEFSQTIETGIKLKEEIFPLCLLDFSRIEDGTLQDLTGQGQNAYLVMSREERKLNLLDILISPGSYLDNGSFVKNAEYCFLGDQPHLKSLPIIQTSASPEAPLFYRFYLDHWYRMVTDLEAPRNHDVALGNIDTTADLRSVWQVKYLVDTDREKLEKRWSTLNTTLDLGRIQLRRKSDFQGLSNGLFRIEIHHSGWSQHWPPSQAMLEAAYSVQLYNDQRQQLSVKNQPSMMNWLQLDRPLLVFSAKGLPDYPNPSETHKLVSIVDIQYQNDQCILNLSHAVPEFTEEETLYVLPIATYKYSRNNGCLAYPLSSLVWLQGQNQVSAELSFPGYNGMEIKNGSWLELGNLELQENERPGLLFQVENFISDRLQLILSPQRGVTEARNSSFQLGTTPTLTLWEGNFTSNTAPVVQSKSQLLRDGIEVKFEASKYYCSGQYWSSAIREALPMGLDWPGLSEGAPEYLEPEGPQHSFIGLKDITLELCQSESFDLRNLFRSLIHEPLADIDKETVEILKKTAKFMALLGIEDWQIDARHLPAILEGLARFILEEIFDSSLRLLGTTPDNIRGITPTGETLTTSGETVLDWQETTKFLPSQVPEGEIISAKLAGLSVLVCRSDNSVRIWSNSAKDWSILTYIPHQRSDYSIAWDETRLYIVGGHVPGPFSCWRSRRILSLDSAGQWTVIGATPRRNRFPVTACNGGFLYVASGYNHRFDPFERAGYLNLKNGVWRSLGESRHLAIEGAASVFLNNQWLIFGGKSTSGEQEEATINDSVFAYDPITDQWIQKSALPRPLSGHRIFPSSEGIYVIGGKSNFGTFSNTCFLYKVEEDSWQEVGELSIGRSLFGLLPLDEKEKFRLYAIGGFVRDDLPAVAIDGCTLHKNLFVYR